MARVAGSRSFDAMAPVRKLLALPAAERRLLALAAVWLIAILVGLRLVPFGTLRTLVAGTSRHRNFPASRLPSPERISWAVAAVGRRIPGGRNCLAQALVALVLLGRDSRSSRLRIGVGRTPAGDFQAHAWVERDGVVLLGGRHAPAFTPLAAPPGLTS